MSVIGMSVLSNLVLAQQLLPLKVMPGATGECVLVSNRRPKHERQRYGERW
jgi:hypothetical protein